MPGKNEKSRCPALVALGILGLSWGAFAVQPGGWRGVRGTALDALFADQDLGDGVHYAYQFHRGGSLTPIAPPPGRESAP